MQNVSEYQPYAEASQRLTVLETRLDDVNQNHASIMRQLNQQTPSPRFPSAIEDAVAIADGKPAAVVPSAFFSKLREDELSLRTERERLDRALEAMRIEVERQRDRARLAALATKGDETMRIRKLFLDGLSVVRDAMLAEERLLLSLGQVGFGLGEPRITETGHWRIDHAVLLDVMNYAISSHERR